MSGQMGYDCLYEAGTSVETRAHGTGRLVMPDPAIGGRNKILPAATEAWWKNSHAYFYERIDR